METCMESLNKHVDNTKVKDALSLMLIYVSNIVKDPTNVKFRRIRTANAKFSSTVWSFEEARTLLLLAGFEENDEFLILPDGVDLQYLQGLLQEAIGCTSPKQTTSASSSSSTGSSSTQASSPTKSSLKLGKADKGVSLFNSEAKPNMTLLSYLVEMGYDKSAAEIALVATGNKGVQPAMDWIDANPDKVLAAAEAKQYASHGPYLQASQDSGEQSSEMHGIMDNSMMPAAISRYKKSADEKHKFQEKKRLEAIEDARKDKKAERKHREYLMKNLQAERDETKEKFEREKAARSEDTRKTEEDSAKDPGSEGHQFDRLSVLAGSSDEERSKIRIKLPNDQDTTVEIGSNQPVKILYEHICKCSELSSDDFTLHVAHPPTDLDNLDLTIKEAGLCPSAVLVVRRLKAPEPESEPSQREPENTSENLTKEDGDEDHSENSTAMEEGP